jgi:heparosan-N-sulfate-glucuronate 5-epimerase
VLNVFLILLFLCSLGALLVYREQQNIKAAIRSGYRDIDVKYTGAKYTFDGNGIPLYTNDNGNYCHTVLISQFALGAYEHYLKTRDTTAKEQFFVCADWLRDNLKLRGNFYYWEDTLPLPSVSAMSQGEGASVLIRAFSATGEATYLETAKEAIIPIFYDLSEGGVSIVKGENYIFPQEWPGDPLLLNTLNGAIYAYLGVHDYYKVTNDLDVKTIDDKILKTFQNTLGQFDTGYWSLYCQGPNHTPASAHYQLVHVQLLRILYSISGEKKFLKFAEKFEHQAQSPTCRVQYVLANHLRQIRNLTSYDRKQILNRLGMILRGAVD